MNACMLLFMPFLILFIKELIYLFNLMRGVVTPLFPTCIPLLCKQLCLVGII